VTAWKATGIKSVISWYVKQGLWFALIEGLSGEYIWLTGLCRINTIRVKSERSVKTLKRQLKKSEKKSPVLMASR